MPRKNFIVRSDPRSYCTAVVFISQIGIGQHHTCVTYHALTSKTQSYHHYAHHILIFSYGVILVVAAALLKGT